MKDSLKRLGIKSGSLTAIIISFALVPIPGWKDNPTGFQLLHEHSARWIVFLRDSVDNNTRMIATLDSKAETLVHYQDIKREYREHERMLYDLVDDKGNFKSDFKKKRWERRDDEIKDEVDRLKEELEGFKGLLNDGMLFASRQR